jgi:hypothetical protein
MHSFGRNISSKNVALLELLQSMNATMGLNAAKIQIITRTTEEDKMSFATKTAEPIELGQIPRSKKSSLVEGTL